MTKAYSYLRFSTPEQMRGDSFRRQSDLAVRYAASHELELDDKVTFHDLGVSAYRGKNVESGRLRDFLQAVHNGLVDRGSYLLVESLDRISRQTARKALADLGAICDEDITLVTLADNRVYTKDALDNDPMALLMSLLVFIRANEESATKSRRVKAAWEQKRREVKDRPLTARCPGWLVLDRQAAQFKLVPERADVVRRIFDMALDGLGKHKIAETLNREATPTFGDAKRWQRSYIHKILRNPAVVGHITPHEMEWIEGKRTRKPLDSVTGYYPPVVERGVFLAVQSLQAGRAPLRGRHANGELRNLFGGLAVCPKCGGTMTRVYKGKDNGLPRLVCTTARDGAGCTYRAVSYDQVEGGFLRVATRGLPRAPAGTAGKDLDKELSQTQDEIDAVDLAGMRLLEAIEKGSSPTLVRRLQQLENEREALSQKRATLALRQAEIAGPAVKRNLALLKDAANGSPLNRGRVNALLRQLFDKVVVDYEDGLLCLSWKQGGQSEVVFAMPEEQAREKTRHGAGH